MKIKILREKWKWRWSWSVRSTLVLCLTGFFLISIYAEVVSKEIAPENEKISLTEALYRISVEYQVFFSYDQEAVQDVVVFYEPDRYENVEHALDRMLTGTSLHYRVFNNRYIILYESHPEAINSLKDMVQHLESVIDKEDKASTPRKNLTVSTLPPRSSVFLVQPLAFSVSGTVTDQEGEPLIGVNIQVKGTDKGTSTDFDGSFSLEDIHENAILVISYVGYQTQEVAVAGKSSLEIVLAIDAQLLDEVVVVGYGTLRRRDLTGSVSSIKSDKLTIAPVTNVTNTLGGQLPGLKTKQTSGLPGSDGSKFSIRGFSSPLVIVDGVESSLNNIDASQIESISVLKDGSASIYGARAGNGVILVTLKRGEGSRLTVAANSSYTLQNSTNIIKSGSSGQRAEWAREEHINAGLPASLIPWSRADIQKFYDETDSNYLNTDWFSATIRPWTPQQNHNISLSGGSEKIKYYSYLGYNQQETISKHDGGQYQRFNLQTTIDANITEGLTISSSLNFTNEDRDFTAMNLGHENYYYAIYDSDPKYPLNLPDPTKLSYAGSSYGNSLFVSSRDLAGYNHNKGQSLRLNGSVVYKPKQVEGLQLKAFVNYNGNKGLSKLFRKQPEFYTYDKDSDTYKMERKAQDPTMLSQGSSDSKDITQQYSISYENIFRGNHRFSMMAIHERINYDAMNFNTQRGNYVTSVIDQLFAGDATTSSNNSSASEMGRVSYIGRLNYAFQDRYMLEGIIRADASAKFPEDGRWGYFPSISTGWVISEESFLSTADWLDNLKLRASYGESGDDGIGNYQYYAGYSFDIDYILGSDISQGIYATGLANPVLSWEKLKIYNGGIDFSINGRRLYGTMEVFYRLREGIPGHRSMSLPSTFGASLPLENLNSIDTRGFEFELGTSGNIGRLTYDFSGNIAWARSKWVSYDEPEFSDPDQKRIYGLTGKWTDARFGYLSDGLFSSQEEIMNLGYYYVELSGNEKIKPGDVKLLDVNGDGNLDWRDQVEIGKGTMPAWTYGFSGDLRYKQFDLTMLLQGAFGYTTYIDLETAPTTLKYENRWTEDENNRNSLVPRPGSKNPSNWLYSDYRNHNTSYIRLKSLAIGYDLSQHIFDKTKFSNLRVYLAGTNLVTLSNLNKLGVDPEAPEGIPAYYYPQQRTLSIGISINY